jgi:hypothetical protein
MKEALVMASVGMYQNTSHMYGIDLVGDDDSGPGAKKEDLPQPILVLEFMDAT